MRTTNNVGQQCVELTDDELEIVSGSEIDIATFFQTLSNTLRAISETNKSIIANLRT